VCGAQSQDQVPKPTDARVKAVYLYNFGRFVEWPAQAIPANNTPFTVCILGQDPFGSTIDAVLAKGTIDGRPIMAKRIVRREESIGCQILFLSSSEGSQLNKILEILNKTPVLTVSDMPQFSQHGGMIQFVLNGNTIRFEVNLAAAQRSGLTPSSELLRVATVVRKNQGGGD
jgi:hypothetical protein